MNSSIPVVILSAGSSSRMYPLCATRPKGDLILGGISILARTVLETAELGHRKFILVVNQSTDQEVLKKQILSQKPDLQLLFVSMIQANGMGDAVLNARQHLTEPQFVVMAPYHFSATEVLQQMLSQPEQAVICATETNTPWSYGVLKFENNKPVGVVEKPPTGTEPSNQKVVALYVLNQEFLSILEKSPADDHYNFEIALNELLASSEVGCVTLETEPASLKYPWHLLRLQEKFLNSINETKLADTAQVAKTAIIDDSQGGIILEEGANIGHAARIVGPAYIGKNVVIGDFCLIRQSTLEEGASAGANTEVVRSVILEESSLHFGYIADSIIDRKVKIGAGLITANKRLDRKPIKVLHNEKKIDSNLTNLGIIVGEEASLGIRTSTMPGVLIGSKAVIYPGLTIKSAVAAEERHDSK